MKKYLILCLVFGSFSSLSQTKIGTTFNGVTESYSLKEFVKAYNAQLSHCSPKHGYQSFQQLHTELTFRTLKSNQGQPYDFKENCGALQDPIIRCLFESKTISYAQDPVNGHKSLVDRLGDFVTDEKAVYYLKAKEGFRTDKDAKKVLEFYKGLYENFKD